MTSAGERRLKYKTESWDENNRCKASAEEMRNVQREKFQAENGSKGNVKVSVWIKVDNMWQETSGH